VHITYFSIQKSYEIKCKMYLPENRDINNIIVGVHGFAGDKESSMLEKLALSCSASNTGVVCFDLPAHGKSPVQEDMLTIENCKNDLFDVLSYIESLYPHVSISIFATSFGGYITLLCADKLEEFPLVLRAPAVSMRKVLLENVLRISASKFKEMGFMECGFERQMQLPYRFYEDLLQQRTILNSEFRQKILVLHGERDDIVPLYDILDFCEKQKNIKVKIIQGADHRFKNEGEMDKIIQATKDFLNI